jgi:TusA-related sulfurtransferase
MKVIVDARGISRAERVLLIERAIQKAEEEIVVLADDDNEKEDISHAARNHGWMLKGVESHGESYRITISKH